MILKFLYDPRLINYVLMSLFLLNAIRWSFERQWGKVIYWIGSLVLTIGITVK